VIHVDRGGEATYHGPGQLVVYLIVRLVPGRLGIADLVRGLAEVMVDLLQTHGISASYDPERPGLWVGEAKIASVGMRVRNGVSYHGAALNVTTELEPFSWIVPCGMPSCRMTSMASQLPAGQECPAIVDLASSLAERVSRRFGYVLRSEMPDS
jgi:lipoyl(octanoyl) transferase